LVPSCPCRQEHDTRIKRASPPAMRPRRRVVAASARRRSSSQRALSPRSGVSKPTRRYTAPFKRTVSPSITSMIWPDGLTLLRCHIIHAAMAAAPSAIAASTPRAKGTRGYLGLEEAQRRDGGWRGSARALGGWRHANESGRQLRRPYLFFRRMCAKRSFSHEFSC